MKKTDQHRTVLITGASSGIGYALAKEFARAKFNLVLVARSRDKLENLADTLEAEEQIKVAVFPKDLSVAGSAPELVGEIRREEISIDILVNNAGFGNAETIWESAMETDLQMMQLNMVTLTQLTKLLVPGMIKQHYGRILNVGSVASFVPTPGMAIYCASKAYVLSFSEAIAGELRGTGVTVTTLCPGVTVTGFIERAKVGNTRLVKGFKMTADQVAKIGFKALLKGKTTVVTGLYNRLMVQSIRFTPRTLAVMVSKLLMRK